MAASDYTIRGSGGLTPLATLQVAIGRGAEVISLQTQATLTVGTALMVGGEIMAIRDIDEDGVHVSRGCADTIPKTHVAGTIAWILDRNVGFSTQEFVTDEIVAVKLLMRAGSRMLPAESVPPNDIRFVGRFIRPYPPGNVRVNDDPWYIPHSMVESDSALSLSWAHRDRVLQADVLQGHEVGNIGPEPGTTYSIDVLNGSGTVLRSIIGIEGTSFSYTMTDAILDFGLELGEAVEVPGVLALRSVRDGYESMETYPISFTANAGAITTGWGLAWGLGYNL